MEVYREKSKELHGYFEGSSDAVDKASAQRAIDYKADVCKKFINLNFDQIDLRLTGSVLYASRKVDGEMGVLFYNGADAVIINRSGRVRMGLPCVEDAKRTLIAAGVKSCVLPAELHVEESSGRTRISDVLNALADVNKIHTLRLAVFDVLDIDDQPFKANSYEDTHRKITELFGGSEMCFPVRYKKLESKSEVKAIFKQWVEEEGGEGLVVRCELPLIFKIKPRYTIDAAVVGYSEGTGDAKGQIRSLLLAMMTADGYFEIIGKTGGGFSDEAKIDLLNRLQPLIVPSQYIEVDTNQTAFHMVRPEIVIEVLINDVLFETTSGVIYNAILDYSDSKYLYKANQRGLSLISPIFARFREDKTAVYDDIRLEQINDFAYIEPPADDEIIADLPKSKLIARKVYKKVSGSKLMVLKFMAWKTNKEKAGFNAYVFHLTNFSSDRKDALQREVVVSNDIRQIQDIYIASMEKYVKSGWIAV